MNKQSVIKKGVIMDIRYLILDKEGNVLYRYKYGTRFQWDFTLPGPAQGGTAIDLHVLSSEERQKWLNK